MRRLNIILAGLLASCSTFASTGTATSRTANRSQYEGSDPKRPGKWLETSDPNSPVLTCDAKCAFNT